MKSQHTLINQMRLLNKRTFNPVILKFAGASHSPISIIRHVGRRSGTPYKTPVIVQRLGDRFVFAMPYGRKVDWYRNVLSVGQGIVVWRGSEYPVENPGPLVVGIGLPPLPFILRLVVRIVGVKHFMQMKSASEIA